MPHTLQPAIPSAAAPEVGEGGFFKDAPAYLVAKYIPDVFREEPRNIGVILWTPYGVCAKFLGESPQGSGEVTEQSAPGFIQSLVAYREWIAHWRGIVSKGICRPPRGAQPVEASKPEFLDALATSGQGNFILSKAGFILDPVPPEEVEDACSFLFDRLVA